MSATLIRELAAEALSIRKRIAELDKELETLLARHPDTALIRSLPGMGAVLTAELIAEAGNLHALPLRRCPGRGGRARSGVAAVRQGPLSQATDRRQ